ncbi:MAG: hypothetical protein QOG53_2449 [Frankiales bacterium]|jgi:hypothetical protein|nr:hypothetical protein [Frankiales bacterium]
MAEDDVQLTDLEVIQRWSLAVRSASAERGEVVAALRADLAWLEGRRATKRAGSDETPRRPAAKKSATKKATSSRSSTGRSTGRR